MDDSAQHGRPSDVRGSFRSAGEVPREVGQLFEERGIAVLGSGGSSAYRHGEAGESAARSRPRLTA